VSLPVLRRALAFFLPCVVVVTIACGLAYAVVQFDLRSGANDPQQQLAEDAAAGLDAGAPPSAVVAADTVDVSRSLAPFVLVFDPVGKVLAGNARLDGQVPVPPVGVLETARRDGRDAVTWQPREGIRIAAVAVGWKDGSVLAGRSLRLVEGREDSALLLSFLAWVVGVAALAAAALVASRLWPGGEPRST
jgi:hypothetical protein